MKEVMISIVIVVSVLGLNKITQDYTNYSVETMSQQLDSTREEMEKKEEVDSEKVKTQSQELLNTWEGMHDKLAYYLEHDELEKVETQLIELKSNIETEEYEQGIAKLDNCKFVLEHIQDKEAFLLVNIF